MNITILGAGTWGTALAALFANNGHRTTLWSALPQELDSLSSSRMHPHLSGAVLPDSIIYEKDEEKACHGAEMILFVVPSEYVRSTAKKIAPFVEQNVVLISAAKGLEKGTLKSMTDIIDDEIRLVRKDLSYKVAALSGPTHAEEVAVGLPTSIVAACEDENVALRIADTFKGSCMRAYTNADVRGVELCGALKNIIAIAAGINRGMGFGDNSLAMLITRGAAEIMRMGEAMGCERTTFMGLSGIGDLIVTCTSRHSRNNRCGTLIGQGKTYEEAAKEIGMVVEGYYALEAAIALSQTYQVEMPITQAVYDIIVKKMNPKDVMKRLMNREIKSENVKR